MFREMGFVVSPTLHSGILPYIQPTRRMYLTSLVSATSVFAILLQAVAKIG